MMTFLFVIYQSDQTVATVELLAHHVTEGNISVGVGVKRGGEVE